jgi:hypothetical protein
MTYATTSKKTDLEKLTLAWVEPSERLILWNNVSGAIYKRDVEFYTIGVRQDDVDLIDASSTALSQGEYYFDESTKEVYVRMSDDSNPQSNFISANYRIHFSDVGIDLPHDLDSGIEVPYEPYIDKVSDFPLGIDNLSQSGIAVEASGNITFFKNDFFISYFDRLIWENKNISIYSYLPEDNSKKLIFSGEIVNKSYSSKIGFNIRDFIYKLKQPASNKLFKATDGNISEAVIGRPKRILYGRVKGVKMQSLDQVLDGFDLTGTFSVVADSTALVGVGSNLLDELSPEDEIKFTVRDVEYSYSIESITDDTNAVLTEESEIGATGLTISNTPKIPYREKNRTFHIAGHKLREPTTTITDPIQLNRLEVDDIADFYAGDTVLINSQYVSIKRISGDILVLSQNLDTLPSIGASVVKSPIDKVYFNGNEFVINRDWSSLNVTESKLVFENTAEFNVAKPRLLAGSISFTGSSRNISGTNTNFLTQLKSRDWIRSDDFSHQTWYEVLEVVDDTNLILRVAYAGANKTSTASQRKNVVYINDESIVTCDCMGKENASGEWVKTASDVAKDLLIDSGFPVSNLDIDSFTNSDAEGHFITSLKVPLEFQGEMLNVREIINLINKSVFGSLVTKNDFKIAYDVLSPERPEAATPVIDSDIKDFSINTKTKIYGKVIGRYLHQDADRYTGEGASSVYEYENDFVKNIIESSDEKEEEIYLYNLSDVETIIQRKAFIYSLTQSIISVKGGGLFFADKEINDKIYLRLEKLYSRFGSPDDLAKIGIISSIKRSGLNVDLELTDLGNLFNRTAAITNSISADFTAADANDKIISGYIVDNDTELPDNNSESEWSTNLIG